MTVGDRVVLYHRVSRTALVLNPTGGRIWETLSTPQTLSHLAEDLCERFPGLSTEDAARDVAAFLAEMQKHAMVSLGS
jgi:Coenzyme PQQ synthesis protein D (PqqD)